jgi:hypothetical protein
MVFSFFISDEEKTLVIIDHQSQEPIRSRVDSLDSGISGSSGVSIRKKSKRRLPWEEADSSEQVSMF